MPRILHTSTGYIPVICINMYHHVWYLIDILTSGAGRLITFWLTLSFMSDWRFWQHRYQHYNFPVRHGQPEGYTFEWFHCHEKLGFALILYIKQAWKKLPAIQRDLKSTTQGCYESLCHYNNGAGRLSVVIMRSPVISGQYSKFRLKRRDN